MTKLLTNAFDSALRANRYAAGIILAERERYAGLPVTWAELIMSKLTGAA